MEVEATSIPELIHSRAHGAFGNEGQVTVSYQNYKFTGYSVYTNLPPQAPYGATQPSIYFCQGKPFDEIAEKLAIDSVEFRLKNHLKAENLFGLKWKIESCA